jgi:uncharacterized protein
VTITVDSNVYISAFVYGGKPLRVLQMAVDGEIEVASSGPILDETLRVLREKFELTQEDLLDAEIWLRNFTRSVQISETLAVVNEDPDDDRVLECAVSSGSEVIVSGDKDLLRLGTYRGIKIMPVSGFLGEYA